MSPEDAMLAIECSQRQQTVAIAMDARLEQEEVEADRRDVEDLLPAIDRLTRRMGLLPSDIRVVAVDGGPGGFTGLRMAHAVAQSVALAQGAALVQVSAAAVAAEVARREGRLGAGEPCWVALACKAEEAWTARVDPGHDPDLPVGGESRTVTAWQPEGVGTLIADGHLPEAWIEACDRLGIRRIDLQLDAVAVLTVGRRLLAAGVRTPPEAMVPVYPREAEAVRLWRKRVAGVTDGTSRG